MTDDVLFDKRLIERHIRQGLITQKQVDERLGGTEDAGELADVMDLEELETEMREKRRPE